MENALVACSYTLRMASAGLSLVNTISDENALSCTLGQVILDTQGDREGGESGETNPPSEEHRKEHAHHMATRVKRGMEQVW